MLATVTAAADTDMPAANTCAEPTAAPVAASASPATAIATGAKATAAAPKTAPVPTSYRLMSVVRASMPDKPFSVFR